MCLILFAWRAHPRYPLVVAANRDEFHARPTAAADFWADAPQVLAGTDLQAGGTWLGITRAGRFAAITNYREPDSPQPSAAKSRGHLVRDFLTSETPPRPFAEDLLREAADSSGFNLLLGAAGELVYASNRAEGVRRIDEGVHGLSNHLLDTDWPKVLAGRERLARILGSGEPDRESLLTLLTDRALKPGAWPDRVDHGLVLEELTRHNFIVSPVYGTRSSTVLTVDSEGRVDFTERQFGPDGRAAGTRRFRFANRAPGSGDIG
jgi:uncharacterized protein with NRDE domain